MVLGVVTERMFLPLDSEFKVTVKAEQSSDAQQMLDGQCAEMRRLWEARLSKLEIVERMVRRSWEFGIRAKYLLVVYSWYGAKSMMALSIDLGITAVLCTHEIVQDEVSDSRYEISGDGQFRLDLELRSLCS